MSLTLDDLLNILPTTLRDELIAEFNKLLKNYREGRWEPAELDGGKLSEIVYSVLHGYSSETYPAHAFKPPDFYAACKAFEKLDKTIYPRAIRVQIPRILIGLYEIRNNRGVGHVGGDVNPNRMDATLVVSNAKWLVAELIRFLHQVNIDEATDAVNLIIQRETEFIWNIGSKKRVLLNGLDFKEKTLLLLSNCVDGNATDDQLFDWVEYSNKNQFKSRILKAMHSERLVEYDENTGAVHISPHGIKLIEDKLPKE
jgi:hypothetical protein